MSQISLLAVCVRLCARLCVCVCVQRLTVVTCLYDAGVYECASTCVSV